MAKKKKIGNLADRSNKMGMRKVKEMMEDRLEYETMKDMINSLSSSNQPQANNNDNPQFGGPSKATPEALTQYTEWLNSLPEDQRQLGMQLISMMHSMESNPQMSNPMTMMFMTQMMQMMNQQNNNNNDGLYTVLAEVVKNQNNGNNTAELINAINNAKSNEEQILNTLLSGLIQNMGSDDEDKLFDKLRKLKEAGLITDPSSMLEVKRLETDRDKEKYKIDRDFEIKKMEIEKDREQTEKASDFLSDIADTIKNLEGGEEEEGGEDKLPPQKQNLQYPCPNPNCSSSVTITPDMQDGQRVKCGGCGKSIRVRRKKQGG